MREDEIREKFPGVGLLELREPDGCVAVGYIPTPFKNDKEIVMAAVAKYGMVLKYASDQLKNDKEIVKLATIAASKSCGFCYASNEIKNDAEF